MNQLLTVGRRVRKCCDITVASSDDGTSVHPQIPFYLRLFFKFNEKNAVEKHPTGIKRRYAAQLHAPPKDTFQKCFLRGRDLWEKSGHCQGTTLKEIRERYSC